MANRWEDYFEPGEKLLWEGKPLPGKGITPAIIGLALFGAPFFLAGMAMSGGSLLWMLGVPVGQLGSGEGVFMFFFGLPFLGIGIGMVVGPWYAVRHAHRKVRYALSDRRAYIASQWWAQKLEAYPISKTSPLSLENDKTVYFHINIGRDSDGDRTTEEKGFVNIAEAKQVFHLMRDIQNGLGPDNDD